MKQSRVLGFIPPVLLAGLLLVLVFGASGVLASEEASPLAPDSPDAATIVDDFQSGVPATWFQYADWGGGASINASAYVTTTLLQPGAVDNTVLKVTYNVEATRVEQRTDFDRLVVDVETKNSMAPRDALASAGKTLVELFGLARELNVEAEGIDMGPSPTDAALAADLALPIEDLDLTVRSYNCLKREGIHTVGELVARSEADLLDIRNFGAKSITEVKEKLAGLGLNLKDSPLEYDPSAYYDDAEYPDDELS